jgi:hypothetical protein
VSCGCEADTVAKPYREVDSDELGRKPRQRRSQELEVGVASRANNDFVAVVAGSLAFDLLKIFTPRNEAVILRKGDSGSTNLDVGSITQGQRAMQSSGPSGVRSPELQIANQVLRDSTRGVLTHAVER